MTYHPEHLLCYLLQSLIQPVCVCLLHLLESLITDWCWQLSGHPPNFVWGLIFNSCSSFKMAAIRVCCIHKGAHTNFNVTFLLQQLFVKKKKNC